MGIIRQLDYDTAVLVAAGEMIERPASIVKELVENSIDAGAKKITVEIQNGGITLIRVSDNGCGMSKDDLPMSIKRNATSKIRTSEDIAKILTLGFRGEALASIAAVADLRIRSKRREDEVGAELEIHPGMDTPTLTDAPMADGTTIIVENLFENIPARRKFLKRDAVEGSHISDLFEKLAFSNPDISMTLLMDGKNKFTTPGDGDLRHTIYSVYGSQFASELIELSYKNDVKMYGGGSVNIEVRGFIGTPKNVHGNRTNQIFYINGRNVRSRCLQAGLEQAFTSYMESSRFPACVMFVNMPPEFVDVNIHPTKLEVKFVADKPVFEAVYYAVRGALERHIPRPKLDLEGKNVKEVTYEMYKMLNSFVPLKDGSEPAEPKPVYNNQRNVKVGQISVDDAETHQNSNTHIRLDEKLELSTDKPAPEEPVRRIIEYEMVQKDASDGDKSQIQEMFFEKIPDELDSRLTARNGVAPEPQRMYQGVIPNEVEDALSSPRQKNVTPMKPFDKMTPEELQAVRENSLKNPLDTRHLPGVPTAEEVAELTAMLKRGEKKPPRYRIIGEVFLSYVIVEVEDKVLVIDKHAAHERIIFEELKAQYEDGKTGRSPAMQVLLTPIKLTFDSVTLLTSIEYEDEISAVGFEYKACPVDNTVEISAIPAELSSEEAVTVFEDIAANLSAGTGSAEITKDTFFEKSLYQASCKAAIKICRQYDEGHLKWICDRLLMLDYIKVCPHGRPVAFELTKSQIERSFKRI